ncbi:MAG: hypothetical protein IID09_08365, partial [Candidatus Hydrogenedentes bacterium]|nr:hypothetical protein [Candidatus Hydrogenedentota bacterium]
MTARPDNIVPMTPDARSVAEKFGADRHRELLTILFTDLVDSTQLQSDLGNLEAARITELHRKLVRDELALYDAREIVWAGDSCLAVFAKPSDAAMFALRLQMQHRETSKREPRFPLVRIGIHLGEIVVRHGGKKEDIFGLQVSETARIMSVARGGQVYCSRAVFDSARGSLRGEGIDGIGETFWTRHGLYVLKGSEDPIEICEIGDSTSTTAAPEPNEKCRPVTSGRAPTSWGSRAALAAVIVAVALGSWWFGRGGVQSDPTPREVTESEAALSTLEPIRVRRFAMSLPNDQPLAPPEANDGPLALSPDGEILAYNSWIDDEQRLVLRRMDELEGRPIPGAYGVNRPFFSPDGNWVGFVGNFRGGRKLMKASVDGGDPVPLADVEEYFPSNWSDQGYIVYTPGYGS